MKLLLDENLPHELRHHLTGHEVFTVSYMGWSGIENGDLMAMAAAGGFDAMLTMDSGIPHYHDVAALSCSLILISAASFTFNELSAKKIDDHPVARPRSSGSYRGPSSRMKACWALNSCQVKLRLASVMAL